MSVSELVDVETGESSEDEVQDKGKRKITSHP